MAVMGRKPKDIDVTQIRALLRLKPTLDDTAAFFECSTRTIERFIREHFDCTFVEFREQNMVHTRLELIRTAVNLGKKGNVPMLIFCLKNLCGWKDRPDEERGDGKVFELSYKVEGEAG